MPMSVMIKKSKANMLLSLSAFISGSHQLSTPYIIIEMDAIANRALINPLMIARLSNGFEMNHLVAPTICMVLIKNRLENIASFIVLSINIITITAKTIANPNRKNPIFRTMLFRLLTTASGYFTSLIIKFFDKSAEIILMLSLFTYAGSK